MAIPLSVWLSLSPSLRMPFSLLVRLSVRCLSVCFGPPVSLLSVCLSVHLYVEFSASQFANMSFLPSVCPQSAVRPTVFICLSVYPWVYSSVSACTLICLTVCRPMRMSVCPSVCPYVYLFLHVSPSACLSLHVCEILCRMSLHPTIFPYIHLFVHLSVLISDFCFVSFFVSLLIYLFILPCVRLSVCKSLFMFVDLSHRLPVDVRPSVCLSFNMFNIFR